MNKFIKPSVISLCLYLTVMLLSHIVMGDITHKYRWDLIIAYLFGQIYILLLYKK